MSLRHPLAGPCRATLVASALLAAALAGACEHPAPARHHVEAPPHEVVTPPAPKPHHEHAHMHPHEPSDHHHHSHPHPHLAGQDGHHHPY